MRALVIKSFILCLLASCSSAYFLTEFKSHFLWKVNLALIPVLENPFLFADASPPPEEVTKLKEKIRKGKELLEELNENLEKMKEGMKQKKGVDQKVLDKIIEIKDSFQKLKVDPTDLSKELLEQFREKVIEAFKLVLESYGLDKLTVKQKTAKAKESGKANLETTEEIIISEEVPPQDNNKVDNTVDKSFPDEL